MLDPLAGHVVVLAGVDAATGAELLDCGTMLAVVSSDRAVVDALERAAAQRPATVLLAYHADPTDASTWTRLAPHIEQRVGPVDAVLSSPQAAEVVTATFAEDIGRRGHGAILEVRPGMDPVQTLREQMHRTR